jgi:hypothetical protein
MKPHETTSADRSIEIRQSDYPGGIQIWGSNPALFWTSTAAEEEGIHVHAFRQSNSEPEIDDTFSKVTIDGIGLDPMMVRVLMAQNTLPHLNGRVRSMECGRCGEGLLSTGDLAFTAATEHTCAFCGQVVRAIGRVRKTIANPLPRVLARLAAGAPRAPQSVKLDLLPETP